MRNFRLDQLSPELQKKLLKDNPTVKVKRKRNKKPKAPDAFNAREAHALVLEHLQDNK